MSRYIYMGGDAVRREDAVIGVFDLDNTSWSHLTRSFLTRGEQEGRVVNAAEDIPRSFVLCTDGTVILTQPTPATLTRRLDEQERFLSWQN